MNNEEPTLDDVLHSVTEAGIRLPFSISDLRRWAEERRRVSKGSGDKSGEFLPEISLNVPSPKARASTRPTVDEDDDEVDELDMPGEPEMWRDILEREEPEDVAKVLGPVAKRAAAKLKAEALANQRAAVPRDQLLREDAAEVGTGVTADAKSVRRFAKEIPGLREKVNGAKSRAKWIRDYGDEVAAEAEALLKRSEAREAAVAGLQSKFDAAMGKGDLDAASALRDQMQQAAADAAADKKRIEGHLRNKLKSLAKVEPPTKYTNQKWEDVYQKPPKGFHVAKERELFDIIGNGDTYRGAWVQNPLDDPDNPGDPDSHVTQILHHATRGTGEAAVRKATYKPEYTLARERAKWDRIAAFKEFSPTLFKYWRDELATLDKPNLTPTEQKYKQELTVALLAQVTGMRRGGEAGDSALKDPKEIRAALIDRAEAAGASQELLDRANAVEDLERDDAAADLLDVMAIFDEDEALKENPAFKYDLKKNGLPEIRVPTYGATTLKKEDVTFETDADGNEVATFKFRGKSGVWNEIKLKDPAVIKSIKEMEDAAEPGGQLFPGVTGDSLKSMMDITVGMAQGMSRAEAEAATKIKDDDPDSLTGKFKPHDLRRLWANNVAPDIFNRIMKEKGRLPVDADEFSEWIAIASVLAAEELGNEAGTFLNNYLSMASFKDSIQKMIDAGGPKDPEEYWQFGARLLQPGGVPSLPQALQRGQVMDAAAQARARAAKAATARRAAAKKTAAKKAAAAKRAAPKPAR